MSNSTNIEVIKYLDAAGLSTLWGKISDTFVRNDDIASIQGVNLILKDNPDDHILYLCTKKTENGTETIVEVSSWNYSDFYTQAIKDGFLKEVSLENIDKEHEEEKGQPAGTYLKFVWNTNAVDSDPEDELKEQITYINVTDLTDYTQGDYIKIENGEISIDTITLASHLASENVFNIGGITTRVANNEDAIAALQKQFDLTSINQKLDAHDRDITDIKTFLEKVPSERISDEEIANLDKSPDQSGGESTN